MSDHLIVEIEGYAHLAKPYSVSVVDVPATTQIQIVLHDDRPRNRGREDTRITLKVDGEKLIMGDTGGLITRALLAGKSKLQERLAQQRCDDSELRLWAAKNRDIDLMDNRAIPMKIREAYAKFMETEGTIARRKNVVEVERARLERARVRREESKKISQEAEGEKEEEDMTVKKSPKIVRGAKTKTPPRKPRCPVHKDEMEFVPEEGKWKCQEDDCNLIAKPRDDSPVGTVMLGKGQLDMRVIFAEPGKEPRVLLVSDNNVALDVTDYISDMEKFLKFNRPQYYAESEKRRGGSTANVTEKNPTLLLSFEGMKIQGCENA